MRDNAVRENPSKESVNGVSSHQQPFDALLGSVQIYDASGEGVCSNRQSAVIWGRGGLAKSSYNFYSG